MEAWKARARKLKSETYSLYLAYKDRRTPWYAKAFAALVVAYAFSPIDLVPDFIPVLGYLDDLILVPLGVALALKMIPTEVIEAARAEAATQMASGKPVNWVAGVIIVAIWVGGLVLAIYWIADLLR
ncbi:MAG: DUF1232 domain-containing protein [Anaerolineales bacterium]|nr:DUF1232 domain-containing protein [Anaerolineales bacterium]